MFNGFSVNDQFYVLVNVSDKKNNA